MFSIFYFSFIYLLIVPILTENQIIGTVYNVFAGYQKQISKKADPAFCIAKLQSFLEIFSSNLEDNEKIKRYSKMLNSINFGVFVTDPTNDYFTFFDTKNGQCDKSIGSPNDVIGAMKDYTISKDQDTNDQNKYIMMGSASQFIIAQLIFKTFVDTDNEWLLNESIVNQYSCKGITDKKKKFICDNFEDIYITNGWSKTENGRKVTLLDVLANRAGLEDGFFNVYTDEAYSAFGSNSDPKLDPLSYLYANPDSLPKINNKKIFSKALTQSVYTPVVAYTIALVYSDFKMEDLDSKYLQWGSTTTLPNYTWYELNDNNEFVEKTRKKDHFPYSIPYFGNGIRISTADMASLMANLLTGKLMSNYITEKFGDFYVSVFRPSKNDPQVKFFSETNALEYLITTKYLDEKIPDYASSAEFPSRAIGGFRRANINHDTNLMILDGNYPGFTVRMGYYAQESPLSPKFSFYISYNTSDDNLLADEFLNWFSTFFSFASTPNRKIFMENINLSITTTNQTNKEFISESVFTSKAIKQFSKNQLTGKKWKGVKYFMPDRVPNDSYLFPLLALFLKIKFRFRESGISVGENETAYVEAQNGFFSPLDPKSSQLLYMMIDSSDNKYIYTQDSVLLNVTSDYVSCIVYISFCCITLIIYVILAILVILKKTKKSDLYWVETCFCIPAKKREIMIAKHHQMIEKKLADKRAKLRARRNKRNEINNKRDATKLIDDMDLDNFDSNAIYNIGKQNTQSIIQNNTLSKKTSVINIKNYNANDDNSNDDEYSFVYEEIEATTQPSAKSTFIGFDNSNYLGNDNMDFINSADVLKKKGDNLNEEIEKIIKKRKIKKAKTLKQHKIGHILVSKIMLGIASLSVLSAIIGNILEVASVFELVPDYNMPFISFNKLSHLQYAGFAMLWIEVLSFFIFIGFTLYESITQWSEISKYWFSFVLVYIIFTLFIISWMASYGWLTTISPKPINIYNSPV